MQDSSSRDVMQNSKERAFANSHSTVSADRGAPPLRTEDGKSWEEKTKLAQEKEENPHEG